MKNAIVNKTFVLLFMLVAASTCFCQTLQVKETHPRLILSETDIDLMRGNALSGIEPWKSSWSALEEQINSYIKCLSPTVYKGDVSMDFYHATMKDGTAARDLAIGYQISRKADYANKAIEIIDAWSSSEYGLPGASFDSTRFYLGYRGGCQKKDTDRRVLCLQPMTGQG